MADILTRLEDKMDERYAERRDVLAEFSTIVDWPDACYRAGYLKAMRDVGLMIREIRNPELPHESGEIPDILNQGSYNG